MCNELRNPRCRINKLCGFDTKSKGSFFNFFFSFEFDCALSSCGPFSTSHFFSIPWRASKTHKVYLHKRFKVGVVATISTQIGFIYSAQNTILQYIINVKDYQQGVWPCHDDGLVEMFPTTLLHL